MKNEDKNLLNHHVVKLNKRARKLKSIAIKFCKKYKNFSFRLSNLLEIVNHGFIDFIFENSNNSDSSITIRAWLLDGKPNWKKEFIKNLKGLKNPKKSKIRPVRVNKPKAKSEYVCSDCGKKIHVGEVYTYIFGLDENNKSRVFRLCSKCSDRRGIK